MFALPFKMKLEIVAFMFSAYSCNSKNLFIPGIEALWFLQVWIKCRWLFFLKLIWKVSHINPPISMITDEPHYCNENVATPKATNFNYQPRVHKSLRGIDTLCTTYNMSFLHFHPVME